MPSAAPTAASIGSPQYLDFSLYGGSISNNSTRGIANNTVASGFETATASYGGWVHQLGLELRLSHSVRQQHSHDAASACVMSVARSTVTARAEQDLSVGRRSINDLEERAEVQFSTLKPVSWSGTVKSTISVGAIELERLDDQTIDTVLLGQNLSLVTPGQASAVGGGVAAGIQYHPNANCQSLHLRPGHRDERQKP